MSETSESNPIFDKYGNIIDKEAKTNRGLKDKIKNQVDTGRAWFRWASHNISAGNWRRPSNPGEVGVKLEALNERLKNAPEVIVDKNGNIMPVKESHK